jgi:hypothetical protein
MALIDKHPIGVQSGFYIAPASGFDPSAGQPFTKILVTRTKGLNIVDETPTEYVYALQRHVITDVRRVQMSASFYGDLDVIMNMASNLVTGATNVGALTDLTQAYTIFVVDKVSGSNSCYILPNVQAIVSEKVSRAVNYERDNAKVIPITFVGYDTDDPAYQPLHKGTVSEMGTLLGSRNPLL